MNDLSSVIRQLEEQKSAIERARSALREVSGTGDGRRAPGKASSDTAKPRKRRLSPEGRARIVEATRRRWADKRAAEAAGQPAAKKARHTKKRSAKQATAAAS